MARVCPWWLNGLFDNPLRWLFQKPKAILSPYVRAGMTVADIGCGMGYFTPTLAELVGAQGRVQAVDLQREQLARVRRRVGAAGLSERLQTIQATSDALGLEGALDFVLAFWMVHEVPDQERFFCEIAQHLAPGGHLLVAEPWFHVRRPAFARCLETAARASLVRHDAQPPIRLSYVALLTRLD